jgi:hypothetical protein
MKKCFFLCLKNLSFSFQFLDKDGPDFKRLRMDQVDVKRRDEEEKKLRQQDKKVCILQCSGSMTFWCGSGSADPCLRLMDPSFPFEGTFTSFFKNKSKRSHKTVEIKVFLNIFAC